jgi:hypothetical protein
MTAGPAVQRGFLATSITISLVSISLEIVNATAALHRGARERGAASASATGRSDAPHRVAGRRCL